MASIYRRGRVWWIHYLVGGKSVARSLKTTNERMALEKKKHLEALDVTGQLAHPSNTPIEPFLQSFCEFLLATQTRKGAKNDLSYLRQFFGPCCEALKFGSRVPHKFRKDAGQMPMVPDAFAKRHIPIKRLEQLSGEMINAFIQDRIVEDGIAPKTANRIREVLHRVFSYASEQHGYVCPDQRFRNPAKGVRRIPEPAPVITWMNLDQIQKQLVVLANHPMIRAMVATYIYAGLRREEVTWLTPSDVDLGARMIQVRAKEIDGQFWQPKTKRNRAVPISQDLFAILDGFRPDAKSVWFFAGPSGGRWNLDDFSSRLREINRAGGLRWSCLDFRHTFGSQLAQKGESLYKIAELMGNSPEICKRHYAALIPEAMRDTVEFANPSGRKMEDRALLEMLLKKLEKLGPIVDEESRPRFTISK